MKKYLLLLLTIIILLFSNSCNASYISFKQKIYNEFEENSTINRITDFVLNITSPSKLGEFYKMNCTTYTAENETSFNREPRAFLNQENKLNLTRIIGIITFYNGKIGLIIQRVIGNVIKCDII